MKIVLSSIVCLFVFTMCKNHSEELLPELSYAESLMRQHPDSALSILNAIEMPDRSSDFQYANWCLLMTQARDKNYIRHESDSLINSALDYFQKQTDPIKQATALYYKARVEHDWQNAEEAITYYLRARDIAQHTTDYNLMYLINSQLGALYIYRDLTDQALEAYQSALDDAIRLNDSLSISYSLSYLGRIYATESEWTQSVEYYKEAVSIAEKCGSIHALNTALTELSAVYNRMNQLDSSLYYGQKALLLDDDCLKATRSPLLFGLGHTYELLGAYEQADIFLKKAIQNGNIYTVASVYQVLSEMNRKLGKYEDALAYNDQYLYYADSIKKVDLGEKIAEIQKKYDHEKLINANNQLIVEKSHIKSMALGLLIILLLVISALIIIYQRRLIRKERNIQQTKELLRSHVLRIYENETVIRENEELIKTLSFQLEENAGIQGYVNDQKLEIASLSQKNKSLETQNKSFREDIEYYIQSLQEKAADIKQYEQLSEENSRLQEREVYLCRLFIYREIGFDLVQSPKYLSENQKIKLEKVVNQLYPEFTNRLKKDFPTLTTDELCFCCLLKLRFNTPTIAVLVAISTSSVTKRKQRLKEHFNRYLAVPLTREMSVESYIWEC